MPSVRSDVSNELRIYDLGCYCSLNKAPFASVLDECSRVEADDEHSAVWHLSVHQDELVHILPDYGFPVHLSNLAFVEIGNLHELCSKLCRLVWESPNEFEDILAANII